MAGNIGVGTRPALENQRLGGVQIRVAALCTLVQICDGYDLQLGCLRRVPALIRECICRPSMSRSRFYGRIG